jgi:hypothetical protein
MLILFYFVYLGFSFLVFDFIAVVEHRLNHTPGAIHSTNMIVTVPRASYSSVEPTYRMKKERSVQHMTSEETDSCSTCHLT